MTNATEPAPPSSSQHLEILHQLPGYMSLEVENEICYRLT